MSASNNCEEVEVLHEPWVLFPKSLPPVTQVQTHVHTYTDTKRTLQLYSMLCIIN